MPAALTGRHRSLIEVYLLAHRVDWFAAVAIFWAAVALLTARLPIPYTSSELTPYAAAVVFNLCPLFVVPSFSVCLGATAVMERGAPRSLCPARVVLLAVLTSISLLALGLAALTSPVAEAGQVLVENTYLALALTTLARVVMEDRFAWIPAYAAGLIGVTGPQNETGLQALNPFDRDASLLDLSSAVVMLVFAGAVFVIRGARTAPD
ncbi:hypothetical protein [Auraticoccus monumenti]|uniref:Uncharacterized protein n=1 Tax=Auraticoccus monumenti TaxID=675864 RepID=A0A1G6Z829_9ACTN|nr:hypothetical protein [Auraticoccus monumenti]SDD98147.1 hypothetical protein SAMN04489747_2201 [Auraticoccus monumenti]